MIVFFLPDLRAGGAEKVMLSLLAVLSKDNHETYILLLGKKEGALLNMIPQNVLVQELGVSSGSKMLIPFIKFCYKYKPNVVLATLGASLTTALAKSFIPKSITIINRLGNTIGAEKILYTNKVKQYLYIFANKMIAKLSDKLIFQCHYMEDDFIKETNCKLQNRFVIYNPVDVKRIKSLADETNSKISYDFIAVGRLNVQKDYFTLLKAAKLLKQDNIKFTLAILGEGNLRTAIEKDIDELDLTDSVFLLGHQSNPYPYMKSAKYLVSSSLYEGFSNVIVEALCLGTPILASDCPGGNSETINKTNGRLFPVKNERVLAELMKVSLHNLHTFDRDTIVANSQDRYEINGITDQYQKIIRG